MVAVGRGEHLTIEGLHSEQEDEVGVTYCLVLEILLVVEARHRRTADLYPSQRQTLAQKDAVSGRAFPGHRRTHWGQRGYYSGSKF